MKLMTGFWLQQSLKQGRFLVMFLVIVGLFVLNGFIYAGRYQEDATTNEQRVRGLQQEYAALRSPDNLAGNIFLLAMPPNRWRFIADGNLEDVPTGRWVNVHNAFLPTNPAPQKQQLLVSWDVDLVFIVSVVLTFLASVLTFDAVSGEREQGTLRLVISNSLPRSHLVLSKVAASVIALAMPLLVGILANALILSSLGTIELNGETFAMYGLTIIYSLLAILVFVSLGVLVSALTRTAITSLIVLLLLWTLLIVVLPGAAHPLAKEFSKPRSPQEYSSMLQKLQTNFWNEAGKAGAADRAAEMARADGFQSEKIWGEFRAKLIGNQQNLIDEQVRQYYKQAETGRAISRLAPGMVFGMALSRLAGTDLHAVATFLDQAGQYRNGLYTFMAARDALDPDSPHILNSDGRGYLSTKPLGGTPPPFVYYPEPMVSKLEGSLLDVGILSSLALCIILGAVLAFNRYDVRS